jgi:hypothetical protein
MIQIICTVAVILWAVMYIVGLIIEILRDEKNLHNKTKS